MMISIKDFFRKCNQIRSFLWIWSYLLTKSLMKTFTFCAVTDSRIKSMDIVLVSLLLTLHRYLFAEVIPKMFKKNVNDSKF